MYLNIIHIYIRYVSRRGRKKSKKIRYAFRKFKMAYNNLE